MNGGRFRYNAGSVYSLNPPGLVPEVSVQSGGGCYC